LQLYKYTCKNSPHVFSFILTVLFDSNLKEIPNKKVEIISIYLK